MKQLLLLTLLFFSLNAAVAQQHGSISGTVTTTDGEPVAYVTVGLKGTTHGSSTTDKGHYRITISTRVPTW